VRKKKQKAEVLPGQKGSTVKGKRTEGWLLREQAQRLPGSHSNKPKWMQRLETQQKAIADCDSGVVHLLRKQAD
jgi:predicted DNA-binding protein (MmcQ/YjbR family)